MPRLYSTNPSSGGGGGVASNSFTTIQTDAGTSPTASSAADTLTLTSSDGSVTLTGNSLTDTVNFVVNGPNVGGFTQGAILFGSTTGTITDDPGKLFYSDPTNRFGINTSSPSAQLHITGVTPTAIATTPGTASDPIIQTQAGIGGTTTIATTGVGGAGGGTSLTMGIGGRATLAAVSSTGGKGGNYTVVSGIGGAASVAGTGINRGGAGGDYSFLGGTGGAANGVTSGTNTGGKGGTYVLTGGNGGAATASTTLNLGGDGGGLQARGGIGGLGADNPGDGGSFSIGGGAGAAQAGSAGGSVTIFGAAGTSTGSGGTGGGMILSSGSAGGDDTVSRAAGNFTITVGSSKGSAIGGQFQLNAGDGGAGTATAGAAGGLVLLAAGNGGTGSGTNGPGGNFFIKAGAGSSGGVISFYTGFTGSITERARFDASGRLQIGMTLGNGRISIGATVTNLSSLAYGVFNNTSIGASTTSYYGNYVNYGLGGSLAITSAYGYFLDGSTLQSGATLLNQYGYYAGFQSLGQTCFGMVTEGASHGALWLNSKTDVTNAQGGIHWGASRDTNLYRSAVNTLKTDGSLNVVGTIFGASLTFGSVLYVGASGALLQRLSGSTGQVLTSVGATIPIWAAAPATTPVFSGAKYYTSGNKNVSPTQPIDFDTQAFDTGSFVTTGSAWKFTAATTGYYSVSVQGSINTANGQMFIYKNGSQSESLADSGNSLNTTAMGETIIKLNATDFFDIRSSATTTTAGSANQRVNITIEFLGT